MVKSSPEKLAQALRANLRRRKAELASVPAQPAAPEEPSTVVPAGPAPTRPREG